MKKTYKKSQPQIITYRNYKYFNNDRFRKELQQIEAIRNNKRKLYKDLNLDTFSLKTDLRKIRYDHVKQIYLFVTFLRKNERIFWES